MDDQGNLLCRFAHGDDYVFIGPIVSIGPGAMASSDVRTATAMGARMPSPEDEKELVQEYIDALKEELEAAEEHLKALEETK